MQDEEVKEESKIASREEKKKALLDKITLRGL